MTRGSEEGLENAARAADPGRRVGSGRWPAQRGWCTVTAGASGGSVAGSVADGPGIGELVRGWRERALLTQEQVAERAGLSLRTVRRLESGEVGRYDFMLQVED
jgi:hypothetical protein